MYSVQYMLQRICSFQEHSTCFLHTYFSVKTSCQIRNLVQARAASGPTRPASGQPFQPPYMYFTVFITGEVCPAVHTHRTKIYTEEKALLFGGQNVLNSLPRHEG